MSLLNKGSSSFQSRKELHELLISQVLFLTTSYLLLALYPIFETAFGSFSFNSLFNTSLLNLYGGIIKTLAVVIFLVSFIISYNSFVLINSYHIQDFSIVMSLGGIDKYIHDYLSDPFIYFIFKTNFLAFIFSSTIGFIIDFFLSLLFRQIPFSFLFFFPNISIIVGCIINIIISLFILSRVVGKNLSTDIENLRSFTVDINTHSSKASFYFLFAPFEKTKNKLVYKLTSYNISRLSLDFIMNLFNLSLLAFVIFSSLLSPIAVNESTDYTMKQAIGEESFAITKQSMKGLIVNGYDITYDGNLNPSQLLKNSLFSRNSITDILNRLKISQVILDERIILFQKLKIILSLSDYTYYNMYVVGYDKNNFISNFRNYALQNPKDTNQEGSLLATWNLVQNPSSTPFELVNYPYKIFHFTSLIQDPFVKGNVIYLNLNSLIQTMKLKDTSSRNVIFLKNLQKSDIPPLKSKLESVGLTLINMQEIINHNSDSINYLGLSLLLIDIPLTITFIVLIDSFSKHLIHKRKSFLRAIKVLGAKNDFVHGLIWLEIKSLILWGSIIGLLISLTMVFGLFIPNALLSNNLIFIFLFFNIIVFFILLKQVKKTTALFYNGYVME